MPLQNQELSVKELAVALDVAYITALGYLKKGMIKGFRRGGQWRITSEELDRFLREGNRREEEESE